MARRRVLGVQEVSLMLLALRFLACGRLEEMRLLLREALQGRAGTADASAAAAAAAPAQRLLLDGQQSARICGVAVTELLLDESVQDRPRGLLCGSHVRRSGGRTEGLKIVAGESGIIGLNLVTLMQDTRTKVFYLEPGLELFYFRVLVLSNPEVAYKAEIRKEFQSDCTVHCRVNN